MEAALGMLLEKSLGEYISGGIKGLDALKFPLTLRDLKLNEKKIQEDMDEDGGAPFELSGAKIGSISVNPGWFGTVEVVATDIVLNFSFSAVRAMNWAMKPEEKEDDGCEEEAQGPSPPALPPAPVAPRFCTRHDASEKRVKAQPRLQECGECHIQIQTSYADFSLCPGCSDAHKRCMICGDSAPTAGSYMPAQNVDPQGPQAAPGAACSASHRGAEPEHMPAPPPVPVAPTYCTAHDASEKRVKAEPRGQECMGCHLEFQTNYRDFTLCQGCASSQQRCMICGACAPAAASNAGAEELTLPAHAPPGAETCGGGAAEQGPRGTDPRLCSRGDSHGGHGSGRTWPAEPGLPGADPHLLGRGDSNAGLASGRAWPKGGWREGNPPKQERPGQLGCGLPCSGDGGDALLGFLKIFDFRSWTHCMADGSQPRSGKEVERCDVPGSAPEPYPWRGGGA